jgi:hypothetical protein
MSIDAASSAKVQRAIDRAGNHVADPVFFDMATPLSHAG